MLHLSWTHKIPIDSDEFDIEDAFTDYMKLEWFEDPLVLDAIKEVDGNSIYYGNFRWESPVLGVIGAEQLSGGIKTAIAAYYLTDKYFPLAWMGDNLANTLQRFSEVKDIHFSTSSYILNFNKGHLIYIDEWDSIVDGYYPMNEIVRRQDTYAFSTDIFT